MDKATLTNLLREVREDRAAFQRKMAELDVLESYLSSKIQDPQNGREASPGGELTQGAAAERVLRDHGKPMSTNDIVEEMVAKNYYPERGDRKQLVNSVYSALRRTTSKFSLVSRGTWGLAEWG